MGKPGRKKAERIEPLVTNWPPDREFLRQCWLHLLKGTDPSPEFVRELLDRYVKVVRPGRFTGPEIAAMVDYEAIRATSTGQGINEVQKFLNGSWTEEAIKQAHKRYGMRKAEIDRRRREWQQSILTIYWTDELLDENRKEHEQYLQRLKAYEKAKKDLFG